MRGWLCVVFLLAASTAFAFQPIPKESARALGVTRGRAFSAGAVFVNGKYIEPPYVVERWGTGIRINQIPVTGQVIDWSEFVRTQDGVKIEKKEVLSASAPALVPQSAPVSAADSDDINASSLDDLFDDDPKPAKRKPASKPAAAVRSVAPATPRTVVTYALTGDFRANDESKALVRRVNAARTEIDRTLRTGGFICFGDSYSQVTGDRRTLLSMLESLPELLQRSATLESFRAGVRTANLVYLNEVLCEDLYRNKIDYRKLKDRRERIKSDEKWNQILEDVSQPIF